MVKMFKDVALSGQKAFCFLQESDYYLMSVDRKKVTYYVIENMDTKDWKEYKDIYRFAINDNVFMFIKDICE